MRTRAEASLPSEPEDLAPRVHYLKATVLCMPAYILSVEAHASTAAIVAARMRWLHTTHTQMQKTRLWGVGCVSCRAKGRCIGMRLQSASSIAMLNLSEDTFLQSSSYSQRLPESSNERQMYGDVTPDAGP